MSKTFAGSRTRHGTPSGWQKHKEMGDDPCAACFAAKADYDRRRRAAPERQRQARLNARAQSKAYVRLAAMYRDDYRRLYEAAKAELTAEADQNVKEARRQEVIEETAFLLDSGVWPPQIATRLGYKNLDSLRDTFIRWGLRDLEYRLQPSVWDPDVAGKTYRTNQHITGRGGKKR